MSRRRIVSILLVTLGLWLLVAGGLYMYVRQRTANPQAAPLPPTIGGLPLVASRTGPAAAAEIVEMHRNPFPMSAAAVGIYQGTYKAQLWVSGLPFSWMAHRMTASMADRIATLSDQPFRLVGQQQIGTYVLYQAEGLGQQHYFFTMGNLVIWLAADEAIASTALHDVLQFYRNPSGSERSEKEE